MSIFTEQTEDRIAEQKLYEIDSRGEGLTRWEVGFVSDLIDRGETRFTAAQRASLEQIHRERVR